MDDYEIRQKVVKACIKELQENKLPSDERNNLMAFLEREIKTETIVKFMEDYLSKASRS